MFSRIVTAMVLLPTLGFFLVTFSGALSANLLFQDGFESRTPFLNDTGVDFCKAGPFMSSDVNCPVPGQPGQDGDFGRDALAREGLLPKDGAGEAGFDYTKLDTNGNELPIGASVWSCVRDNLTGLIWEVKVDDPLHLRHRDHRYTWYHPDPATNGGDAGMQSGGQCFGSSCDTDGFVEAVNAVGLCGARDWRMPSRMELHSLSHHGQRRPSIDAGHFPQTSESSDYWSDSPYAGNPGSAWAVDFDTADAEVRSKGGSGSRVRLVRGLQQSVFATLPASAQRPALPEDVCTAPAVPATTPSVDFTVMRDGSIVRHDTTGLEWQRCALGQVWDGVMCSGAPAGLLWSEALDAAAGAGEGWRLPNMNELRSILEGCRVGPAINQVVFPNAPASYFWSASPFSGASNVRAVDFDRGLEIALLQNTRLQVRLVRGVQ